MRRLMAAAFAIAGMMALAGSSPNNIRLDNYSSKGP
jgi:hypothetical protein